MTDNNEYTSIDSPNAANGTSATTGGDAVAKYQYLLRTASPDQIEAAHEQAFAAMTPAERAEVLQALSQSSERPTDDSASSLARAATRLELTNPGSVSQLLGSKAGVGATLLGSLAAGFIGSAIWVSLTGGDGVGGRPGLLSRILGGGGLLGGLFGNRNQGWGQQGPGNQGWGQQGNGGQGWGNGPGFGGFGGQGGPGGRGGHGGPGGHGGGPSGFGGGPGGGGPGGFGGGPGGGPR